MASPAEDAAVQQDIAAERMLTATAVAVERARSYPDAPNPPPTLAPIIKAGIFAALIAMLSSNQRQVPGKPRVPTKLMEDKATELEPGITDRVWTAATEHVKANPPEEDTAFSRALARSVATRVAAEATIATATALGFKYKVWVSRGDAKVRTSHRELHGKVVEMGKSFKTYPGGGVLDFPGDPRSPFGDYLNCRCQLFGSPTKAGVARALAPADLDKAFSLAASLEQRWEED